MLPACVSSKKAALGHEKIISLNKPLGTSAYHIGSGDHLSIRFYFNKALNEDVVVAPDGKISLQLVDEVQAAGLTVAQLDAALTLAYAKALKTSSENYLLAVGDHIEIKSYYQEKLNDTVIIRPDGKIALQLIDEVQASGHTPAQLDTLLTKKYSVFFDDPDISINLLSFNRPDLTVMVKTFSGQKVYVGGEVNRPGIIENANNIRVLDAIIQAAGVLKSGDLTQVILIRRSLHNQPEIYTVNVKHILQGKTSDVWLKPYDIVYVPKTDIANIEHYIRAYLWDLLPNQVAFSFLYNWNNEVQVK